MAAAGRPGVEALRNLAFKESLSRCFWGAQSKSILKLKINICEHSRGSVQLTEFKFLLPLNYLQIELKAVLGIAEEE